MGTLYDILQKEREELRQWLEFYNVRTLKREVKELELRDVEERMRNLSHLGASRTNAENAGEQIHVQ